MPNQMGGNKNNPKPPKVEKPAKVEPIQSPELQAEADKKAKLKHDLDVLNAKNENLRLEKELRDLENKPQKDAEEKQNKLDDKKAEEDAEKAKEETKAEADRQSDLKKRISLSSYAALKATGPNLHTDTTHKYLKKNWLGQAMDVAESKFQRLREATFGSITTAKETYQHRITRDHAMVATYEARFNDIKRSYIQAFEAMTGQKYSELENKSEAQITAMLKQDEFKINTNIEIDPKITKAYQSLQSVEVLVKKIKRVETVLEQINATGSEAEFTEVAGADGSISRMETKAAAPGLMEAAKDKNFKPQSKQDSKLVSHQFYKLLDVCENELLSLSNFEKAQTVSNLREGITALVGAKFPKRSEESKTINNPVELVETPTNSEQLSQRQLMMMDLFGDKYQFQVQSFGYNGNGDVLFMMIKNKEGNIEQIMLNRKLSLDEQATISQIKAGLVEVGNTVEYKNYDLHYTSKNSTSSKPEFSPLITPTAQKTPTPEAQNNIKSNPNDLEIYKANIENGDMDYLVNKFFKEHTPSTLNGIQSSTKDNVLYDIQVRIEGTEEYKYLAINMDDADSKDHSLFNQLKQIKNSDPTVVITIKNGRIDIQYPQSPEPVTEPNKQPNPIPPTNSEPVEQSKIKPLNSPAAVKSNKIERPNLSNIIENEKLAEPEQSINEIIISIKNIKVERRNDMAKKYFADVQPLSIYEIKTSPIVGNMFQLGIINNGKYGIQEYHTIQIPTGALEPNERNFFTEMSNNINNRKVVNIYNDTINFEENFNTNEAKEPKLETSALFEPIAPITPEQNKIEKLGELKQEKLTSPEELNQSYQIINEPLLIGEINKFKDINTNLINKYFKNYDEFIIEGNVPFKELNKISFIGNGSKNDVFSEGKQINIDIDDLSTYSNGIDFVGDLEQYLKIEGNIVVVKDGDFIKTTKNERLESNTSNENKVVNKYNEINQKFEIQDFTQFGSLSTMLEEIYKKFPNIKLTQFNSIYSNIIDTKNGKGDVKIEINPEISDLINNDFILLKSISTDIFKEEYSGLNTKNYKKLINHLEEEKYSRTLVSRFKENPILKKTMNDIFVTSFDESETKKFIRDASIKINVDVDTNKLVVSYKILNTLNKNNSKSIELDITELDQESIKILSEIEKKNFLFRTDSTGSVYLHNINGAYFNVDFNEKKSKYYDKNQKLIKSISSSIQSPIFQVEN